MEEEKADGIDELFPDAVRLPNRRLLKLGVLPPVEINVTVGPNDENETAHEETIICTPPGKSVYFVLCLKANYNNKRTLFLHAAQFLQKISNYNAPKYTHRFKLLGEQAQLRLRHEFSFFSNTVFLFDSNQKIFSTCVDSTGIISYSVFQCNLTS